MSAPPKLPTAVRTEIQCVAQRKRILAKLIATLKDEQRQLPRIKDLIAQTGASYQTIRRTIAGDPYVNQHPDDASHA
jgi:hypothetical protein